MNDMYLADKAEHNTLKWKVQNAGLKTSKSFDDAPAEEVFAAYNGCGPERWPGLARDIADKVARFFKLCVVVHDWDFAHSDGTRKGFNKANKRFSQNCKKLYREEYPFFINGSFNMQWLNPFYRERAAYRYGIYKAITFFVKTSGGWDSWVEAHKRA